MSYAPKGKLQAGVCLIIIGTDGFVKATFISFMATSGSTLGAASFFGEKKADRSMAALRWWKSTVRFSFLVCPSCNERDARLGNALARGTDMIGNIRSDHPRGQ
ncbi:MAG: hypothetical protein ACLPIG_11235 [Methylocella sp.]